MRGFHYKIHKKVWTCSGLFYLTPVLLWAQLNFVSPDSLAILYESNNYEATDRFPILMELSYHPDPEKAISFANELLAQANSLDSTQYLYYGHNALGYSFFDKGEFTDALEQFFKASEYASKYNSKAVSARTNVGIANVYSEMGNHRNAVEYYKRAISSVKDDLNSKRDSIDYASYIYNLGDEFYNQKNLDSALDYYYEAAFLFKITANNMGQAYTLGSIGLVQAQRGSIAEAQEKINEAIGILTDLEDYAPICEYLGGMSDIHAKRKELETSLYYGLKSLELATKYGLKNKISEANLRLANLYEQAGDTIEAYQFYKDHVVYKDSVRNLSSVQEMASIRNDFEISQKQLEVDLLNEQKRTQQAISIATGVALFLLALLAIGLFRRYRYINRTKDIIEQERNRSDVLLRNILPEETAEELKNKGRVSAKKFEAVSVLFTDFQGFTKHSQDLTPEALVQSVDRYFSEFDKIIEKHGLEKIKTIGDSYMCAGGLPFATEDHAQKVVAAAFEIAEFVEQIKNNPDEKLAYFDIRLGINSGPVVAGVVGTTKFAYDIWGDTVNVAARMESNSAPGRINVSENTYALIKEDYKCKYRGEIEVKNKGRMKMYYVNEKKSA